MCVSVILKGFGGQKGGCQQENTKMVLGILASVTCWVSRARLEVVWFRVGIAVVYNISWILKAERHHLWSVTFL